jgi:hypothetical protein
VPYEVTLKALIDTDPLKGYFLDLIINNLNGGQKVFKDLAFKTIIPLEMISNSFFLNLRFVVPCIFDHTNKTPNLHVHGSVHHHS